MYKVLAAMYQELNEGWVWLSDTGYDSRSIIKIENKKNYKVVYCEYLMIEENFIFEYNKPPRENIDKSQNTIVINSWYRKKLGGLETKNFHELEIKAANHLWGKIRANLSRPQVVVRMAIWLALLSVGLGFISLF